jgi:ABC-type branched-subunit amino acid transport system substrate-binding protein
MSMSMSRGRAVVACLAAVALLVAGCGGSSNKSSTGSSASSGGGNSASAPGVTATSVTIGSHQPLTGPAAPGYSEIAPAAKAYFSYLNAHGGVNGRKIDYIFKDDGYNPTNTVNVVKQLVLQQKVFAIFNGLGTPTHTKVVDFLNASRVPDLFVASGCPCWDDGSTHPYTSGWQTSYQIEGKILGNYLKQKFAGKKVGVLYQDDDFGQGGLAGLKEELPAGQIVSAQPYQPTNTNLAPQITAIKGKGAEVLVDFTIPAFTAIGQLTSFKLGYKPQLVIANVGADPTTLGGLLKSFSKGKADTALVEGAITDGYLPSSADTSNSWVALFKKIHDQYDAKAPFDGNVEYGMAAAYTFAQVLKAAGQNPTRQSLVDALDKGGLTGPGLVPFRFSKTDHGGYSGVQIGQIKGGKIVLTGQPMTTDPAGGPLSPYTTAQPQAGSGLP